MLYRKISLYRAMRLIGRGEVKNLFFQDKDKELLRIDRFELSVESLSGYTYYELEEGN